MGKQIAWGLVLIASLLIGTAWGQSLNEQLSTAVNAAVFSHDNTPVEALIAKGADVNAKNKFGMAPLSLAAMEGSSSLVKLLIAKGADVNVREQNGETPLFHFVEFYSADFTAMMISMGADVNAKEDEYGTTPMFHVGNKAVIELLIAKGADVNARDKSGETPLFSVVRNKEADVAATLISKGADVNARDKGGETPLFNAVRSNKTDVVAMLIADGVNVNTKDHGGETALNRAESKDIAELLIAKGVNVNAKDNYGQTPLHRAAQRGKTDVAAMLITKGADVNARDDQYGETPLFGVDNKDVLELLIAKGADVNAKDKIGMTPLLKAAIDNLRSAEELLIAKGADVNAKDESGRTPLTSTHDPSVIALIQRQMAAQSDPKQLLNNLLMQFKGQSSNDLLRRSIIDLALKQHPAPLIPADAEAAAGRGAYIFKSSKSADDTLNAAKEYLTAIEIAPWVANYYYNLCTVLEKTAYTQQALHACQLYLIAAPNASDAGDMQQRIAGLQYAADRDAAQMKQRTAYIHSRGVDDLYRFGGISGKVSGKDIVLKLFVDWTAAPPRYQVYVGCFGSDAPHGGTHDLVSTDDWVAVCRQASSMHLVIKPEGEGFVGVSDTNGESIRATLDELFKAKQQTMSQAVMFSTDSNGGERYFVTYVQGGKAAGYVMYESDCNGGILKKDPRALPDDFVSGDTKMEGVSLGKYVPEINQMLEQPNTDICATQFASKTGYHFGATE
jgi:ankyrin repeat protein